MHSKGNARGGVAGGLALSAKREFHVTDAHSPTRTILVTGDIVCDCFTYRAEPAAAGSNAGRGTRMLETLGGANLPFTILQAIASQRPQAHAKAASDAAAEAVKAKKSAQDVAEASEEALTRAKASRPEFQACFGHHLTRLKARDLPEALWTFGLCSPVPPTRDKSDKPDKKVWRMTEALGYGAGGNVAIDPEWDDRDALTKPPAVALLDDGNLGFRRETAKHSWPTWLMQPAAGGEVPWVVLKTIHPITSSALWRAVMSNQVQAQRTIVIASLQDLRKGEFHVSGGISWEQTAGDIVKELACNALLQPLRKVAYVIITLGTAGAFLADRTGSEPRYRLIFDPANLEGDIERKTDGQVFGRLSCMAAAIAAHLIDAPTGAVQGGPGMPQAPVGRTLESGIKAGIRGLRTLLELGHGPIDSDGPPGFSAQEIARVIDSTDGTFGAVDVPADPTPDWTILRCSGCYQSPEPRPMTAAALTVALRGLAALRGVPYQEFGQVTTVDRGEIEDLRALKRLIGDYASKGSGSKPLSVAVFGAPGSGKSFLVKQLVKASGLANIEPVEFNLSQFTTPAELRGPLHQVRDLVLKGKLPLVFWDEFDSREYEWLQHFLMPMQDGTFQEGQITHPIGKCIFVFAGGTSRQYQHFGDRAAPEAFEAKKGPDFISRLHGYLNVIGPNPRETFDRDGKTWVRDDRDTCCHLRRALLLRGLLGLERDQVLGMDRGLLRAFLEISGYKHGARSMQQMLEMTKQGSRAGALRRSDLPPHALMSLMVDPQEFFAIMTKDDAFKREAEHLAPHVHEFYRELAKKERWKVRYDVDYADLPDDIKDDNVAAAMRIPEVLALVQLHVVPVSSGVPTLSKAEARAIIDGHIDLLAEAEHDGWMDHKLLNGWKRGSPRDDATRIHDALVPYAQLGEEDKEKDRTSVRRCPEIVERAGHAISRGSVGGGGTGSAIKK